MLLVDTSAWVDYLRGADTSATQELRALLRSRVWGDTIALCLRGDPFAGE